MSYVYFYVYLLLPKGNNKTIFFPQRLERIVTQTNTHMVYFAIHKLMHLEKDFCLFILLAVSMR